MNKSSIEQIKKSEELSLPVKIDGGKVLIERLKSLFDCQNRVQLADTLGVSPATLSIWATRCSIPYDLLIRLSILLNIPLKVLCFGRLDELRKLHSKILLKSQSIDLKKHLNVDGGRTLIERLIHLFKVRSRVELSEILGINVGTFSTWTTRNTVPYELIIRLHLKANVNLEYLCFGKGSEFPSGSTSDITEVDARNSEEHQPQTSLSVFHIENGQLVPSQDYHFNLEAVQAFGLNPKHKALVLQSANKLLFVSCVEKTVTEGTYLYRINDVYKIGAMKLLPDGKVYLLDNGERYAVNSETTHIHGKVVSVLERC